MADRKPVRELASHFEQFSNRTQTHVDVKRGSNSVSSTTEDVYVEELNTEFNETPRFQSMTPMTPSFFASLPPTLGSSHKKDVPPSVRGSISSGQSSLPANSLSIVRIYIVDHTMSQHNLLRVRFSSSASFITIQVPQNATLMEVLKIALRKSYEVGYFRVDMLPQNTHRTSIEIPNQPEKGSLRKRKYTVYDNVDDFEILPYQNGMNLATGEMQVVEGEEGMSQLKTEDVSLDEIISREPSESICLDNTPNTVPKIVPNTSVEPHFHVFSKEYLLRRKVQLPKTQEQHGESPLQKNSVSLSKKRITIAESNQLEEQEDQQQENRNEEGRVRKYNIHADLPLFTPFPLQYPRPLILEFTLYKVNRVFRRLERIVRITDTSFSNHIHKDGVTETTFSCPLHSVMAAVVTKPNSLLVHYTFRSPQEYECDEAGEVVCLINKHLALSRGRARHIRLLRHLYSHYHPDVIEQDVMKHSSSPSKHTDTHKTTTQSLTKSQSALSQGDKNSHSKSIHQLTGEVSPEERITLTSIGRNCIENSKKTSKQLGISSSVRLQLFVDLLLCEVKSPVWTTIRNVGSLHKFYDRKIDTEFETKYTEAMQTVLVNETGFKVTHCQSDEKAMKHRKRCGEFIQEIATFVQGVNSHVLDVNETNLLAHAEHVENTEDQQSKIQEAVTRSVEQACLSGVRHRLDAAFGYMNCEKDRYLFLQCVKAKKESQEAFGIAPKHTCANKYSVAVQCFSIIDQQYYPHEKLQCLLDTVRLIYGHHNHNRKVAKLRSLTRLKQAIEYILENTNQTTSYRQNLDSIENQEDPLEELSKEVLHTILSNHTCDIPLYNMLPTELTRYIEYFQEKLKKIESKKPSLLAADDFFPIFVYVVANANCGQLESVLQSIVQLSPSYILQGESGYYLTVCEAAIEYLFNLDVENLFLEQ